MSLCNSSIVVEQPNDDQITLHFQWRARLASYEPGDPVGWGKTPADAADDLFERLDRSIQIIEHLNPQSTWS